MTQVPLPAPVVQPGYPAHRRIVEAFGTEVLLEIFLSLMSQFLQISKASLMLCVSEIS